MGSQQSEGVPAEILFIRHCSFAQNHCRRQILILSRMGHGKGQRLLYSRMLE